MGVMSELPVKQARFVGEYLVDLNAARAARDAGYSYRSARQIGSELLSKPNIQAVIQARCKETEKRLEIQRDDVIRGLQEAYEEARVQGDPMAMIAAMREIGRMLGYYAVCPTHEQIAEGSCQVESIPTHQMSNRELMAMYQQSGSTD